MNARLWPIVTIVGGLATFGVFVAFGMLPEVQTAYAAGAAPGAVSQFQRAETMADLVQVLGGDPPNPAIAAAHTALNTLDLKVFIAAYTIFLIGSALMIGGPRAPLTWAAIAAAVAGAGGDFVETSKQLAVTADWANAEAQLPIATWHWIKYFSLGASGFAIAALCVLGERRRWILAVLALAPLVCMVLVYAGVIASPRVFQGAITLYWLALLALAVKEAVRAKDAPA
ncbi:MAG: hypothetical protein AB7O98_13890 [Hyphomonadaceae bacterium]